MKPYSTDLRLKIIEAKHKSNESIGQLAERFGVSYSFVSRLLKRYKATASVEPNPHGGGNPPLLNSQQIEILKQLVEEDNDATPQEFSSRLTGKIGVKASLATICRFLQRLELTTKKRLYTKRQASSERVQNLRSQYWTTIGQVQLKNFVFIDETGINLAMTGRHARAKRGKRAYSKCPDNRGKNITMIGAIATTGFLAPNTFEGWTNQEAFRALCYPSTRKLNFGQEPAP